MRPSHLARAIALLLLAAAMSSASAEETIPAIDIPHLNPLDTAKLSDMKAFAGRPLFNETRRPDEAEPSPVIVDADKDAAAAPEFVLLGVTSGPDGSIARITMPSGAESRSLRKGEEIDGWTLQTIDGSSVTITQAGKSVVLKIFNAVAGEHSDESETINSDDGIVFSPAETAEPAPTVRVIDRN